MRRWAWWTTVALIVASAVSAQDTALWPHGPPEWLFGDRWGDHDVEPVSEGVDEALDWLASQQHDDGSWGDVATTAHALQAFVAVGHVAGFGHHGPAVKRAVRWMTAIEERHEQGTFEPGDRVTDARAAEVFGELYAVKGHRPMEASAERVSNVLRERIGAAIAEENDEATPLADKVAFVSHGLVALRWIGMRSVDTDLHERAVSDAIAWLDANALLTANSEIEPAVVASAAVAALLHDPTRRRLELSQRRCAGETTTDPAYELAFATLLAQQGDDPRHERRPFAESARKTQQPDGSWPASHGHDAITSTALHIRALVAERRFARIVPDPPAALPWPPPRPAGFAGLWSVRLDARSVPGVDRLLEALVEALGPDDAWFDAGSARRRALLAFQQAGTTDREGPHASSVKDGLRALIHGQHADGRFDGADDGHQALATLVLSEFYAMTERRLAREPLRRALRVGDGVVARAIVGTTVDERGDDDPLVVVGRLLVARALGEARDVAPADASVLQSAVVWVDRRLERGVSDDRLGALACAVLGATLVDPDRERVEAFFERYESAGSPPRGLDSIAHIASLRAQLVDLTRDPWFADFRVPDDLDGLTTHELVDTVRIVTAPYRYASVLEPR